MTEDFILHAIKQWFLKYRSRR